MRERNTDASVTGEALDSESKQHQACQRETITVLVAITS